MESLEGALSILLSHAKPVTDAQELPDAAQEHTPEDTPADERRDDTNG